MISTTDFKQYGWICPVCGRGLSPWTHVCPCYEEKSNLVYADVNPSVTYYAQTKKDE